MQKFIDFMAKLPTTNVRIVSSIVMAFGTWIKVLVTGWEPSLVWLGFLIAWAGIDAAQFVAKRATYITPEGHTCWKANGHETNRVSKDTLGRRDLGEEDGTEPI